MVNLVFCFRKVSLAGNFGKLVHCVFNTVVELIDFITPKGITQVEWSPQKRTFSSYQVKSFCHTPKGKKNNTNPSILGECLLIFQRRC